MMQKGKKGQKNMYWYNAERENLSLSSYLSSFFCAPLKRLDLQEVHTCLIKFGRKKEGVMKPAVGRINTI